MKVGGQSRNNGIDFNGEIFKVSVRLNEDQDVSIKYEKHVVPSKFISFLNSVPILRTIAFFIEMPILLLTIPILILGDVLLNSERATTLLSDGMQLPLLIGLTIINIAILAYLFKTTIWKLKETWKFHGAEHKTIYAVKKSVALNLEEVRKCPRVSERCGTNFVMFFIFFFIVILVLGNYIKILDYASIRTILAFVIANELFEISDGESKPILKYFYKMGLWQQQHLLTSEPTDIQLQAAISAMKELIELEANEPED